MLQNHAKGTGEFHSRVSTVKWGLRVPDFAAVATPLGCLYPIDNKPARVFQKRSIPPCVNSRFSYEHSRAPLVFNELLTELFKHFVFFYQRSVHESQSRQH